MALKPPFFVVSDTHFCHKKITKYCGRPYDHEQMMIKRWRATVKETHTVLHLGDLVLGGKTGYDYFANEIAPQLSGRKYLILGNHDRRNWDYEAIGFEVIHSFSIRYRGYEVTFDHYPRLLHDNLKRLHVHGHIHSHPYSQGERSRDNNINVSVEVMDYRPHRITRLLNRAILGRNSRQRYRNSKAVRFRRMDAARRAS